MFFFSRKTRIYSVYLTLTVGDKRDNFEFVRLGGRGGVLPQRDSPVMAAERERIKEFLGCLTGDNNVPFDRGCKNAETWWFKLSLSTAWD